MPQPYSRDIPANHVDYTENLVADHVNTIARHVNQLETDANAGGPLDLPGHKASADHDARYMRPGAAAGGALVGTYPNPTLAAGAATGAALGTDVVTTGAAQAKTGKFTVPLIDKGGRVFDVRAYGAFSGTNTPQQSFFQAANDAALAAGGGTVYVPAGGYKFDGTFVLGDGTGSFSGISLMGDSPQTTVITWGGPNNLPCIKADGLKNCNVGNFTLQNQTARVADTQTLTVTGSPTGTFVASYAGQVGRPINPTDTAAAVQTALEASVGVGLGSVTCAGGPLGTAPVVITLTGQFNGLTTSLFTIDTTNLVGGSVTITRTTTGSTMWGLWLQRHTGSGTQIGGLNFPHLTVTGFDVGVLGGDPALVSATSELHFDHPDLASNGTGMLFINTNTLDIALTMLQMSGNGVGVALGPGCGNVSVMNGSTSGSSIADFMIVGSNQGVLGLRNFRTETEKRLAICFCGQTTGLSIDGCHATQSTDGPDSPLIYMSGGRLTVVNSYINGRILGRNNNNALSVTLIGSYVEDAVPFRVSSGYFANGADTLRNTTYAVLNCFSTYKGAGLSGSKFPDQVGMVLSGSEALVPLWAANTDTTVMPGLYVGSSPSLGWSAAPLYGGLRVAKVPDPSGVLTISPQGGSGATTYTYYIVAIDANGNKTLAGPPTTIASGLAFGSLDATHYNAISWPNAGCFGAVAYDVIRSVGGTSQGSIALGFKGTGISDTGLPASAYGSPTRNATADLSVVGWLGINGITPAAPPALPIAAVDAATTQALVNAIRSALIGSGITT